MLLIIAQIYQTIFPFRDFRSARPYPTMKLAAAAREPIFSTPNTERRSNELRWLFLFWIHVFSCDFWTQDESRRAGAAWGFSYVAYSVSQWLLILDPWSLALLLYADLWCERIELVATWIRYNTFLKSLASFSLVEFPGVVMNCSATHRSPTQTRC